MAIKNSCRWTMQGLGVTALRGAAVTNTTPGATMTMTIPTLAQALNAGMLRLKITQTTASITSLVITGSDGTTTIYLTAMTITGGVAGQGADFLDEFQSDLNLKNFIAVVTFSAAPGTATVDFEVWGQENAGGP